MKEYTLKLNSGRWETKALNNDDEAREWSTNVLLQQGFTDTLEFGGWDSDGYDSNGLPCYRMLIWEDEKSSEQDDGAKAIAQICKVGR